MMPPTARIRDEDETDPKQRVLLFAVRLAEDFANQLLFEEGRREPGETKLHNDLILLARDRVNWERVAKILLRRLAPVGLRPCPNCGPGPLPRPVEPSPIWPFSVN